jgi:hypothetical protein
MRTLAFRRVSRAAAICGFLLLSGIGAANAGNEPLAVGDAYVRSEADGTRWLIGTPSVELVFACAEGQFRLVSYKNKCTQPVTEYIERKAACTPFALDIDALASGQPLANNF